MYVKPIFFDENLQKAIKARIYEYNKNFDYVNSKVEDKGEVMKILDEQLNKLGFYDSDSIKYINKG